MLGLNGICVKSHGGTDDIGFAHAVEVGVNLVERDFNKHIKEDLGHLMISEMETSSRSAAEPV